MISLVRVVVPSPKIDINLLGTYEKLPVRRTRLVQRLARSFDTNIHTDKQTSCYFSIRNILKILCRVGTKKIKKYLKNHVTHQWKPFQREDCHSFLSQPYHLWPRIWRSAQLDHYPKVILKFNRTTFSLT